MSKEDEQAFPEDSGWQEESTSWSSANNYKVDVAKPNWKAWLAFSKTFAKPDKNWKKDLPFSPKIAEKVKKVTTLKKTPLPPPTKPIAQIGKRKKERILEEWSEVDMNREIWETRVNEKWERICVECWKKITKAFIGNKLIKPQVFSHKLPKWMFPRYRMLPENIDMVCDYICHDNNAKRYEEPALRMEMSEEYDGILKMRSGE